MGDRTELVPLCWLPCPLPHTATPVLATTWHFFCLSKSQIFALAFTCKVWVCRIGPCHSFIQCVWRGSIWSHTPSHTNSCSWVPKPRDEGEAKIVPSASVCLCVCMCMCVSCCCGKEAPSARGHLSISLVRKPDPSNSKSSSSSSNEFIKLCLRRRCGLKRGLLYGPAWWR